jgi:hypothetical protein
LRPDISKISKIIPAMRQATDRKIKAQYRPRSKIKILFGI